MFESVDHIGVAVDDLDASIKLYSELLEMPLEHRETVAEQGVEAALLGVGDSHVELLAPLADDTPVGKFLAKRGPGMHHVAYAVDDLPASLAELEREVAELIDLHPRQGLFGLEVAFVHPDAAHGVLAELVSDAG